MVQRLIVFDVIVEGCCKKEKVLRCTTGGPE